MYICMCVCALFGRDPITYLCAYLMCLDSEDRSNINWGSEGGVGGCRECLCDETDCKNKHQAGDSTARRLSVSKQTNTTDTHTHTLEHSV